MDGKGGVNGRKRSVLEDLAATPRCHVYIVAVLTASFLFTSAQLGLNSSYHPSISHTSCHCLIISGLRLIHTPLFSYVPHAQYFPRPRLFVKRDTPVYVLISAGLQRRAAADLMCSRFLDDGLNYED